MMEKEDSTRRLTGNAESRKGRRDVVDGDERRQKLVATERQRLGEIVGHVADAGNMPINLITTDDVINACTNFTNVVIRIMRVDESKGGCNLSKNKDMKV